MRFVVWIAAAVSLVAPPAARAWGPEGHMVTAQIAYDRLDAGARKQVDELIGLLAKSEPAIGHFVPAAVWMDEIKGEWSVRAGELSIDTRALDDWHFINAPFNGGNPGGGGDGRYLARMPGADGENVVWALDRATRTLCNPDATRFDKALMLRVLIHLVGDIHQPLHCINRFTATHRHGDRGGNAFRITGATAGGGEVDDLHAYWDGGVGLFRYRDPLAWDRRPGRRGRSRNTVKQAIETLAREIVEAVPKSSLAPPGPCWTQADPSTWASESFVAAITVVYRGIREGDAPAEAYIVRGQELVRQRIALGGYRLAALLNSVFGERDLCPR